MLKRFSVKNYKNFGKEITFVFGDTGGYKFNEDCIINGYVGKGIIYGRNATGKTNLGNAIVDIRNVLFGMSINRINRGILNGDANDNRVYFSYEFMFGDDCLRYDYVKSDDQALLEEELTINNETVYSYNSRDRKFDVIDLDAIGIATLQVDAFTNDQGLVGEAEGDDSDGEGRGWEGVPFLRYILANFAFNQEHVLIRFQDFVLRMKFSSVTEQINMRGRYLYDRFAEYLNNADNKDDFESFLNAMGVKCHLHISKRIDGQYELYFDHKKPITFSDNASSGTISLTNFYRRYIVSLRNPSFIYMDEFDAFFHYEMSEKLVVFLKKKYPECQVILTTHNTNLMSNQLMRPDCLFILSTEGKLTALCDATEREIREGHNLEKLYISGEFAKYE